ncbi:hypothetical protein E2C01_033838 [Portunus trituberculatus]|uniref:Uncharacterized protein n=1 Tax=Portunus trituberculatus TaxID=210409 RepID=A0A5B7F167_PORTR|nr:hypothetical protein [Portunus trituberculatus]
MQSQQDTSKNMCSHHDHKKYCKRPASHIHQSLFHTSRDAPDHTNTVSLTIPQHLALCHITKTRHHQLSHTYQSFPRTASTETT